MASGCSMEWVEILMRFDAIKRKLKGFFVRLKTIEGGRKESKYYLRIYLFSRNRVVYDVINTKRSIIIF